MSKKPDVSRVEARAGVEPTYTDLQFCTGGMEANATPCSPHECSTSCGSIQTIESTETTELGEKSHTSYPQAADEYKRDIGDEMAAEMEQQKAAQAVPPVGYANQWGMERFINGGPNIQVTLTIYKDHEPGRFPLYAAPQTAPKAAQAVPTVYNSMLAAAPQAPEVSAWQPIETAPKDGTHVILWDGEGPSFTGCFAERHGWLTSHAGFSVKPTHWMPLPEGPKT